MSPRRPTGSGWSGAFRSSDPTLREQDECNWRGILVLAQIVKHIPRIADFGFNQYEGFTAYNPARIVRKLFMRNILTLFQPIITVIGNERNTAYFFQS